MKTCPRCGKPISIWNRPLFSGKWVCNQCTAKYDPRWINLGGVLGMLFGFFIGLIRTRLPSQAPTIPGFLCDLTTFCAATHGNPRVRGNGTEPGLCVRSGRAP